MYNKCIIYFVFLIADNDANNNNPLLYPVDDSEILLQIFLVFIELFQ